MIQVNKPFIPPKKEYLEKLDGIWDRNWLTNNGPLSQELERALAKKLDVPNFCYMGNGTISLQIAIKALGLRGKIITTPFTYVATTSSIVWENCEPIFVDIRKDNLNIDERLIEDSITENTVAIMATHVFGVPCNISKISDIAKRYNLKVIYDAAHCFGSEVDGASVLNFGDISSISFHATKVFHTIEGGGLVCNDPKINSIVKKMRNFGHDGPGAFAVLGINGKNSEFHAAMGLVNLNYIDDILAKRRSDVELYHLRLRGINNYHGFDSIHSKTKLNYSYYPIVFSTKQMCHEVKSILEINNIYPRRYFYPSMSKLNYVGDSNVPLAEDICERILCLPLYFEIKQREINLISDLILKKHQNS